VPRYEYACTECGDRLEVVQSFSDDPLTLCSACGGKLRKVFSPVGIVFKGSGFYRTDSRNGKAAAGSGAPAGKGSDGTDGSSSSSDSGSNGKAETDKKKPEKAKPETSSSSGGSSESSKPAASAGSGSKVA